MLDDVDRQITHILTIEPRASFRTIAEVAGISDQTAARRYRKLVEARGLPRTMVGWQAAKQLGMNPNDAEAAIRNAHRVSKSELLAGLAALAEADSQLKSSNPNPRAFMEFLIARLTSSATSSAPAA